jgi:hypothetical protein
LGVVVACGWPAHPRGELLVVVVVARPAFIVGAL